MLAERLDDVATDPPAVHFVGRLGTYRYYNMDQIVAQSLTTYKHLKGSINGNPSEKLQAALAVA